MISFPTFSLIVPVYNGQASIRACVDALLTQAWPSDDREIIVVDNDSTDNTAELLKGYGDAIVPLHESKRGPSAARNAGLRRARGRYVAFTDADCIPERDWLGHLLPVLRQPDLGAVGGRLLALRPCTRIAAFGERIRDQQNAIEHCQPPYVDSANWASPRALLLEQGAFDEGLLRGEDVDLAWRLWGAGYRLRYAPDAIVYHANRATLLQLFQEGQKHGSATVPLHRKHQGLLKKPGGLARRRYGTVLRAWWRGDYGPDAFEAFCRAVFNFGKSHGYRAALRVAADEKEAPRHDLA